ncbi:MAG: hypothetical protein DRJ03_04080 [Chloroflexi bacterium]|nr:MAG: hypothetical protein DRJ03_04080 [Chloroflexota bacterium]
MKKICEHKNWTIYQHNVKTTKGLPIYVAVKNRDHVMEGIDVPDLIADIDEAEFPREKRVKLSEASPHFR